MKRRLTQRLLLNYLLIVCVPACMLFLLVMYVVTSRFISSETIKMQSNLSIRTSELVNRLESIETLSASTLESGTLPLFLATTYDTDWQAMYDYMRYAKPQIHWVLSGSTDIKNVHIYTDNIQLNPGGYFSPMSQLPVTLCRPTELCWRIESDHTLKCYRGGTGGALRKVDYALELTVSAKLMENYEALLALGNDSMDYCLVDEKGQLVSGSARAAEISRQPSGRYGCIAASIDPLGIRAIQVLDYWVAFVNAASYLPWLGGGLFVCFLLLLTVNMNTVYGIARRIVSLTDHIRLLGEGEYFLYTPKEPPAGDEVDDLVQTFNHLVQRTDVLVNQVQKAEILRRQAEFEAYQSRIEPHFLYGTLENLRMLAVKNRDQQVARGILDLAGIMRYALAPEEETTLARELRQVERYLNLQKLRLGDRLDWSCQVEPEVSLAEPCPPFLLQPLAENSIRHGLEGKRNSGTILIHVFFRDKALEITVKDDGAGISPARLDELRQGLHQGHRAETDNQSDNGYALYNISKRIELFYGPGSRMELESVQGQGTCVHLHLMPAPPNGRKA